nr:zinc-binding dehydrogenase [Pseudomonas kairouanensis]
MYRQKQPMLDAVSDPLVLERAKAFILDGLAPGALSPVFAKTFARDEVQDAHRLLEANQQVGKVVVTV